MSNTSSFCFCECTTYIKILRAKLSMVLPPRNIFREYDIRGIIGKELNAENAELIGRAFGSYLQKISGGSQSFRKPFSKVSGPIVAIS